MVGNLGLETRSKFFLIGRNLKELRGCRQKKKEWFIPYIFFFLNPLRKLCSEFSSLFHLFLSLFLGPVTNRRYVQKAAFCLTEKQDKGGRGKEHFQRVGSAVMSLRVTPAFSGRSLCGDSV